MSYMISVSERCCSLYLVYELATSRVKHRRVNSRWGIALFVIALIAFQNINDVARRKIPFGIRVAMQTSQSPLITGDITLVNESTSGIMSSSSSSTNSPEDFAIPAEKAICCPTFLANV